MDFLNRYKKIIVPVIFLFTVLILGYLLYYLFFKETAVPPTEEETEETTGRLPTADEGSGITAATGTQALPSTAVNPTEKTSDIALGGLTKTPFLNDAVVLNPTLSGDGSSIQYYDQNDGHFYKADASGKAVLMSDKEFFSVQNITWSNDKNKAVLEYPDGSNIVYDFSTKQQVTLPAHWEEFSFSPQSNKLVFKSIGIDPESRWLAISDISGSNAKKIEPIGTNADRVYASWSPNNTIVGMYTRGVDFNRQEVFFLGLNDENFKSTVIEGRGFQSLWNEDGSKLVYSVYSSQTDYKPSLWMVGAEGDNIGSGRKSVDLQTWASKCSVSGNYLYCGVPTDLPSGAGIFPETAENTVDNLYRVNLNTGTKTMIAIPDGEYNINDVNVSDDGKSLYFTDSNTERIHKVNLK